MVTMQAGSKFPNIINRVIKKMFGACVSFKFLISIIFLWQQGLFKESPIDSSYGCVCGFTLVVLVISIEKIKAEGIL